MTPLPWDPGDPGDRDANSPKLIFEYSFVNLTHFSVKDVPFSIKSTKIDKIHKIHAPKIQGRVFSEVAEAPQAATTSRTARGGTLKPVKLVNLLVRTNFGDEIDIFFKYSYAHFPCSHSSFACTGTHYVWRLEKLHFSKNVDFSKSQN